MFPQDATEREIPRSSNVHAPQAFPDEIYPWLAGQAFASIVRFDSWRWNWPIIQSIRNARLNGDVSNHGGLREVQRLARAGHVPLPIPRWPRVVER